MPHLPLRIALIAGSLVIASACSESSATPGLPTSTPADPADRPIEQPLTTGAVVAVVDGNTIEVEIDGQEYVVRYLGIETGADAEVPATQLSRFLLNGEDVELERGIVNLDSDGAYLRYVYANGAMVNVALLDAGYADVSGFPSDFKHRISFEKAVTDAQADGRGIWTDGRTNTVETPSPGFSGGTLPLPPGWRDNARCDISDGPQAVIKGVADDGTGRKVYYLPGSTVYSTIEIRESAGDRWFCTEVEARAAGWSPS